MKVNEKSKGELALEKLKNSFCRIEELEEKNKEVNKNRRGK
jgi:hypothetical protein